MHIFILASFAPSLLNFRGPLIRDIRAAGHSVSVGAPDITDELRVGLASLGAEVHETPMKRTGTNPFSDMSYMRHVRGLLDQTRPDVLLTYTIKPNIWGAFAASSRGIPSCAMVTGLGTLFTDSGAPKSLKSRLMTRVATGLYARATARNRRVIFQNPDDLRDFLAAGCLADPAKAALVNGSGIDMEHYARAPLPSQPSFLMISRLLKSKGVREYGEAAVALKAKHPHVRMRLVGYFDEGLDGIDPADLKRWQDGGLEYSGPMSDIRAPMEEASVYVLPSYREGTPRSVLEAMAMGRPVITSDAPGCRETVQPGETGFLVPVREPETLCATMERFVRQPELISEMGEASYRLAQEKYEVGAVNKAMMELVGLR